MMVVGPEKDTKSNLENQEGCLAYSGSRSQERSSPRFFTYLYANWKVFMNVLSLKSASRQPS
jgi:hypothetical protein